MLGMLTEHGPYVMENEGTTFHENEWSWNREVNMLYLEAPAGVGYSYHIDMLDFEYNDAAVAKDNMMALIYWLTLKFPEYQSNDLYLSGESYAGLYVPTLGYAINDYNLQAKKKAQESNDQVFTINLKGWMIGNGVTNWKYDTFPAYIEMAYYHGLYDLDMYNAIYENGCDKEFQYMAVDPDMSDECAAYFLAFQYLTSGVNVYNIYGKCFGVEPESKAKPEMYATKSDVGFKKVGNEIKTYKRFASQHDYTPWLNINPRPHEKKLKDLPPCTFGQPIIDYLNREDVKEALHVSPHAKEWDMCNMNINLLYERNITASQWVYSALKGKYRMLKFSGDIDGAVPTLGTIKWIEELNWKITKEWRPFFVNK